MKVTHQPSVSTIEFTQKLRRYLAVVLESEIKSLTKVNHNSIKTYDLGEGGTAYEIFFHDGSSAYIGPTPVTYKPKRDFQ